MTGWSLPMRVLAMVVGVIVLIVAVGLFVRSCDSRRSAASQARVERSQAEAAANSAKDAVDTISNTSERAAASEDLSRSNEKEIRDAKGADAAVDPDVGRAALRSLCRRGTYRDTEQCRVFKANP